ncbi:uncharacterized protein LOC143229368 [Tachypleus tridentatus]|uniref:uncharacterized protein LOC143229368 n=1 Tax=Tachypleus tridentatus TaxID=6853 RepID=UPI003FD0500B
MADTDLEHEQKSADDVEFFQKYSRFLETTELNKPSNENNNESYLLPLPEDHCSLLTNEEDSHFPRSRITCSSTIGSISSKLTQAKFYCSSSQKITFHPVSTDDPVSLDNHPKENQGNRSEHDIVEHAVEPLSQQYSLSNSSEKETIYTEAISRKDSTVNIPGCPIAIEEGLLLNTRGKGSLMMKTPYTERWGLKLA